jgi:betaine-aldehyde dehydrogenase
LTSRAANQSFRKSTKTRSRHFLGTPFGGFKQSGIGREECLDELLAFSQEKNIHIRLRAPKA